MRRVTHALLVILMLGSAACDGERRLAGLTDSTFVATMAELRVVEQRSELDSAQRAAARERTLQGRGLTAEQLERAAASLATDPDRASAVWQAIEARVRETPLHTPPE